MGVLRGEGENELTHFSWMSACTVPLHVRDQSDSRVYSELLMPGGTNL